VHSLAALVICAAFACTKTPESQTHKQAAKDEPARLALSQGMSDADLEAFRAKCRHYFARLDSLNLLSVSFFEKEVYQKAKENPDLTLANLQFLEALRAELRLTKEQKASRRMPDPVLLPVFTLQTNPPGIIRNPVFSLIGEDKMMIEVNPENHWIKNSSHFDGEEDTYLGKLIFHPAIFDYMFHVASFPITVFTVYDDKKSYSATVTDFGYYFEQLHLVLPLQTGIQ
jgi:hypothetical protein